MQPYKFSQLDPKNRLTYKDAIAECYRVGTPKTCHAGQLKLFFTELLFLTKYYQPGDKVVYVGAAEGWHINILAKFFPELTFDLYDSRRFSIDKQLIESGQITLFREYFTDAHAEKYVPDKAKILFICDIRNVQISKNPELDDSIVGTDMDMQMTWCQIIQPKKAFLKFRLPYTSSKVKYLSGTLYLQPYAPLSTETRLCTSNYETIKEYDAAQYDEMIAWHNAHNRCQSKEYDLFKSLEKKYKILNNWDNCYALTILGNYLNRFKGKSTLDALAKLFLKVYYDHKRLGVRFVKCKNITTNGYTYA